MSTVEAFPGSHARATEYQALVALSTVAFDALPAAIYVCDSDGQLVRYNQEAAAIWGRPPSGTERFCGAQRLYRANGTALRHEEHPIAQTIRKGVAIEGAEMLMERPDGSRRWLLVKSRALRDDRGGIEGAVCYFQDITSRKELDDEIGRRNRELEDFFENSAVGLHIVNAEGIVLRANRAELAMLGYRVDEYVGRHIAEFHADAPVIGQILQKLSCGEPLDRCPARLIAKDGSIRHVLITSNSRLENGKFINTRCFTADVTELHKSEKARDESERRLAATYNAATVGISEADASGRLLRVNDALCQMLGRPREVLLNMSFFDYTHGGDRAEDAANYERQVRGEIDSYSIRKRVDRGDGATLYFDVHSSTVKDAAGAFLYGVRVIRDVTEAKRMEDRIRDSERHLRNLLEALPAAVYTTDAEGRITFFNRQCAEMAGRPPALGDEWCVTWRLRNTDGSPLPHDQCPMAVAIREDRPVRGAEALAERPDGTLVPFIPYPTPLHDAQGKLIGAINMLVDITERKKAEKRQKVLIDELNHRVKNTLATVQSLAMQTARHSDDLGDFSQRFAKRLQALASAHDLLTKQHWEDTPLDFLAREVLAPVSAEPGRVYVEGPKFLLRPRAAINLTMTLGELATNAAKHGALSSGGGSLSLTWRIKGEDGRRAIELTWKEQGGPPVTPPTRRGFGTRLMERCIERDLGGGFDMIFHPQGLTCRMIIPTGADAVNG